MVGTIYCIESNIDGKKYIGQTIQRLSQRCREHKRNSKYNRNKNSHFYNAVVKYGFHNFTMYAIETGTPVAMLDERECCHIERLNTIEDGYNIARGGKIGRRLPIPIDEIKFLYSQGVTLKKIGARYGCDKSVISSRLKSAGVPLRDWNSEQRIDVDRETLHRLYVEECMTTPEIAALYDTSHQTILKRLKRYSIPTRPSVNRKYLNLN